VVGCNREYEGHRAQFFELHARWCVAIGTHPDRKIGLTADQRFPGPGHDLRAQSQPRARSAQSGRKLKRVGRAVLACCWDLLIERIERFTQFEHRQSRHHAVDRDAELGLPAGCDALDTIGHRVHLFQQAAPLVEQLLARRSQPGLARATIKEQYVQRVFELANAVGKRGGDLAELARSGGKAARACDDIHHR
jgi:hypothetical protein